MGRRRNRQSGAMRPSSYTGTGGVTYTADQVAAMLDADRRGRGNPEVPVAKIFGNAVPPAMAAAEAQAQMTPTSPFSPGEPIGPYDGFSRQPRSMDFLTGRNIATRPRIHERVSFDTLHGLITSYDVATICINHRIDSIRALDWKLIPEDGFSGDPSDAIAIGMKALRRPDRINSFETWLAKWLWDVLAYDAGSLYRLRNRGGRPIGLLPVDGKTIAPLLDYWGNPPGAMAAPGEELPPAYVQYANGLPWNWLTRDDLIYEPFRPRPDSPYGTAPIEIIMLNANTDLRFQLHFLQRFTEGNIPEAFASAPETWGPDTVEKWQLYWDSFVYGDQAVKHQIKWMPGGSSIVWSNEKDFTDDFSLFLMRKTCAAFHVVPTDLGFTENANLATGESQGDVQHRVGDLPLIRYAQRILTSFLQDDLGLPLRHAFDLGEEQEDRLNQAQADQIYWQLGAIGTSELREMRLGLPEPEGRQVPRVIFTERGGPIPLNSLFGVAGPIDQETGAPAAGAALPHTAFTEVEGVESNPALLGTPLAVQEYGPGALPPAPAMQPMPPGTPPDQEPVGKEAEGGAPAAGITADTGLYGYDLIDDENDREKVAKAELATFASYRRKRRKAHEWRDFRFTAVDDVTAHRLNDAGRLMVRKDAGQVAVAGLAVLAADTGRALMIQRALDPADPAAGTWEFPGGHLEDGESPLAAAWREWAEETGLIPPPGTRTGSWTSPNGVYQGIVWTIDSEAMVPVRGGDGITNPDDPDGDQVEAIAWWDPGQLPGNPSVRPELLAAIDLVTAALGCARDEPTGPAEVAKAYPDGQSYSSHAFRPTPGFDVVCWYCGVGASDPLHDAYRQVAKAGDGGPKARSGPAGT